MAETGAAARDEDLLRRAARQIGLTQYFSLGVPRGFTVADDGSRVLFVRSRGAEDRTSCLWSLDARGERLLADPDVLGGEGAIPQAERDRRERVRELSNGVVSYSADRTASRAVLALGGALFVADAEEGAVRPLACAGSPVDPRIDPQGRRVAYVSDGALHVLELSGGSDRVLAAPESADVTYGLPEHVASEEMHRVRGHWWSPDGSRLLAARVDNGPVSRWWISDPSDPAAAPRQVPYPVAGTLNADVSLFVFGLDGGPDPDLVGDPGGTRTEVLWDRHAFEYLATADWDAHGPLVSVQSRDQRTVRTLAVDPGSGATSLLLEDVDDCWVRLVEGSPVRTRSGALVVVSDVGDARRLVVGGDPVTGDDLQVRAVFGVEGETVWFAASTEPTEQHVWTYSPGTGVSRVTEEPGLHRADLGGGTAVIESFTERGRRVTVVGGALGGSAVDSLDAAPELEPNVRWLSIGRRALRTALVLPRAHDPGGPPLPVLMCPYGGPALQLVTRARHWYLVEAQWFAEHGFAVVIADGSGTPGRGPVWEREISGDVLSSVIDDQVAALGGVAEECADLDVDLDLGRVAMRGWSYGGLLSLACVLRRPDVFHAAVAGAAPTDMRLYDTHYRERYLGHPDEHPERYVRCSMVYEAASLSRPLLMIHGLADDNVAVANALRMSAALLAAGKTHELVLLPSTTHMNVDPEVDVSLLCRELDFLRKSLGVPE